MAPVPGDRPPSARLTIIVDEIEVQGNAPSAAALARAVERAVLREVDAGVSNRTRYAVARDVAAAVGRVAAGPAREGRPQAAGRAGS